MKLKKTSPRIKQVQTKKVDSKKINVGVVKSTVTFHNGQIVFLDRLSSDIRANNMAIVDRGALIRGIISAVQHSRINLSNATSEEEVKTLIASKLKAK
jgi:hypothetical protein